MLLSALTDYSSEIKSATDAINIGIWIIGGMATFILILGGVIWNTSVRNNAKTEDKVDKLATEVTKLTTLMAQLIPVTKENTEEITGIKINCASNHLKRRS